MIEKLKLEPYIPESLVVHLYSKDEHVVAERYDTIYWVQEEYFNVKVDTDFDCFVDAKLFCTFASSMKSVTVKKSCLQLTLFNKAKYDLDMVKAENIPSFNFPDLPYKNAFDFGGVECAASKSPLQKELNQVYVDDTGCVASNSIVAGVSGKFKSKIPFTVPEGLHSMLNGAEVEWGIDHNRLYISVGVYKIVSQLSGLPDFAWWESCRGAFEGLPEFVEVGGLKSSVSRLSNFGSMVYIRDGRIAVNKDHWEPISIFGNGELFDVSDLGAIATDDKVGIALSGGNLYLKTLESLFVCCSVDMDSAEAKEDFDEPLDVSSDEESTEVSKKSKTKKNK